MLKNLGWNRMKIVLFVFLVLKQIYMRGGFSLALYMLRPGMAIRKGSSAR
jgi:hypothetical protein